MSDLYEIEMAALKKENKARVWIEPLILIVIIFGYCALMAKRENNDEAIKTSGMKKDQMHICQLKQNSVFHQIDCSAINKKYAKLN